MKRLNTSLVTSDIGLVFQHKHLDFIQDKTEESLIHSIYSQLGAANTAVVILYGCTPTFTTTTTTNDTLAITAGALSYLGKIYEVDAVTVVKTGVNVHLLRLSTVTFDASDPSLFTDNITRNVQEIRKAELAQAVTGTGIGDWINIVVLFTGGGTSYVDAAGVVSTIPQTKRKVIEIGIWDMVATAAISKPHGLNVSKIISVYVSIFNDIVGFSTQNLLAVNASLAMPAGAGGSFLTNAANINLSRYATGLFDNTSFDDATINRGFIYIEYMQ